MLNYRYQMHNINKSILVLIRGLPGSGKSYFADALAKELSKNNQIVCLDPDATDYNSQDYLKHVKEQTSEGVDPKLFAYRFLRAKAYKAIENKQIIIWNQPFTNLEILQKVTTRLQEHAQEHGMILNILVIEVLIDPKIAYERIEKRKQLGGHGPSKNTFNRFVDDFSSCKSLGYEVLQIDGTANPNDCINDTLIKITNLQ